MQHLGTIFDIQRMSVHDGPGIRTVVFLKGCPLKCLWCHNPEGINSDIEVSYTPSPCIFCGQCARHCPAEAIVVDGQVEHNLNRETCRRCGICTEVCPTGALQRVGRCVDVTEVLEEVMRDRVYYEESGGGMTLSGGEPLLQYDFSRALLKQAKAENIHTCIDTCGFGKEEALLALAAFTDVVLFDWKESDPALHKQWTGVENGIIRANLKALDRQGVRIILRCPLVPGFNVRNDHIEGIAATASALANCHEIHLMNYHGYGTSKYARIGGQVPEALAATAALTPAEMEEQCRLLKKGWHGKIEVY